MSRKFPLVEMTDQHMCRPLFQAPRPNYFYPSEAGIEWTDPHGELRLEGACPRAVFFRLTNGVKKAPTNPYSEWIFALGKAVEIILVEQWKQMGIWEGSNIKYFDEEHSISGELDCLVRDSKSGELICAELKSIYGYNATRDVIKGTRTIVPKPKVANLLQLLLYVDFFKDKVSYGKLVYYARDSAARREYDVTIREDSSTGLKYPVVDGVVDPRFTVNDIYKRYEMITECVKRNELPSLHYEKIWDDAKIQHRFKIGEVSKTAMETYTKKGTPIGDWNCSYCAYEKVCWGEETYSTNQ